MEAHTRTTAAITGIFLPLITPFRDGALDESSLVRLARHYGRSRIDGLILAATTGEGLTLDEAETEHLVATVAATVDTDLPIYLGLCGSDTRKMLHGLEATDGWPISGYLIACPYYSRPSQQGLFEHFAALAGRTEKPILLYNIPYRTGVNLVNETLFRLAALPNIVGVKDCCADAGQTFDLLRGRPAGFSVLTGEDALFFNAIAHGADGGILASAHADPAAFATRDADAGGSRRRAAALVVARRSGTAVVRRAEPRADQALALAQRPDRLTRVAAADDLGQPDPVRTARSGARGASSRRLRHADGVKRHMAPPQKPAGMPS
jgi:4-hydroxy-tetrahydrodipicolinate synthase